jgi:hypothetical protein
MATKKKATKSSKKRGTRRVAPQLVAPANTTNQDSVVQPIQPTAEPDSIITPTNTVNENSPLQPPQHPTEPPGLARISLQLAIIGTVIAIIVGGVQIYLAIPGHLNDINTINTARAIQTANPAIDIAESQSPTSLPEETETPNLYTASPTETVTATITPVIEPEHIEIRNFLDDLGFVTERAVYEGNWELLADYYCGEKGINKLESFKNWISTLGENAVARRLIENRSLVFFPNPMPNIDWEASQIEVWLFSGERQQQTLKYTDRFTYYLKKTDSNSYCIIDYDTELITHELLQQ